MGKTFTILCDPHSEIIDIKKKICEKIGNFIDRIKLCSCGKELLNENCLSDYGIRDKSVILYLEILLGGSDGDFVDMEKIGNIKTINITHGGNPWRRVEFGLHIEGICKNSMCRAYCRQVICILGYGLFDLILDKEKCECPMCKQWIDPITCGFRKCYYRWTGIKQKNSSSRPNKCQSHILKPAFDGYLYYDPRKSESAIWIQLKIYTTEFQNYKCSVCCKNMADNDPHNITKTCGHQYHDYCFKKVKDFLKRECPMCYEN